MLIEETYEEVFVGHNISKQPLSEDDEYSNETSKNRKTKDRYDLV